MPAPNDRSLRQLLLERAVVDAFRRGGWQVLRQPSLGEAAPDLVVRRGHRYVVRLKGAAEARRDRLVPLLAQAILEAKAAASKHHAPAGAAPLAIVGAPRIPEPMAEELRSFAAQVAPGVAIGIVDLDGFLLFVGRNLESLRARRAPRRQLVPVPPLGPLPHLFSDLNQWILKVLLAPRVPEQLLHAPRGQFRSASQLAKAAGVSLMSAFRCVSLLRADGFLDAQPRALRLVRVEELLQRWRAANVKAPRELPMRWVIPGDPERQLAEAVREYLGKQEQAGQGPRGSSLRSRPSPRVCLALFAAAEALGFGFVRGVAPHLYLERADPHALHGLGLVQVSPGQRADVFVRVPSARESVFRAALKRNGVLVCDVLQVWLDVVDHPARGAAQAQEIWRRLLAPMVRASGHEADR